MENPIKDNPFNILLGYDGREVTKKEINVNTQEGIDTIVIGNLTDIDIAKATRDCTDTTLRSYVGSLNAYAKKCGLTYIPGEHDLQIYTELREIMGGCKGREYLSKVTSFMYASNIMKIAEKMKKTRPELMKVYKELSDLAIKDSANFLYLIKSLAVLGKQPIYVVRKNEDGKYVQISHANPQGKIIQENKAALQLANSAMTIAQVAEKQVKLDMGSKVGSTYNSLRTTLNNTLLDYLLDKDDPKRKDITESMSAPYGEDR